jgi:hypothetical protein
VGKTIVTHLSPDLDALGAVWLLKKFAPEFAEAEVGFVPIGDFWNQVKVDSDPNVFYVDVGLGRFDHHQRPEKTCAAKLVWEWLIGKKKSLRKDEALVRLVDLICEIDHFGEYFWPESADDRYDLGPVTLIQGLKYLNKSDQELIEFGSTFLDAIYVSLRNKVKAEEELSQGEEFKTRWGKAIALETRNDAILKLGLKLGYKVVARKDSKTGQVRIKSAPEKQIDLTKAYQKLKKLDPGATWFLHISKHQLLNASTRTPGSVPSKLSLKQIIEVLKGA